MDFVYYISIIDISEVARVTKLFGKNFNLLGKTS
jgi:hypothetical protein